MQDYRKETEEMIQNGMASAVRKQGLGKESQVVKKAIARVAELKEFHLPFGRIFASSGFRIAATGCAVDWALVEVDEERIGGNVVSFDPTQIMIMSIDEWWLTLKS